jgi:hypothetical protein
MKQRNNSMPQIRKRLHIARDGVTLVSDGANTPYVPQLGTQLRVSIDALEETTTDEYEVVGLNPITLFCTTHVPSRLDTRGALGDRSITLARLPLHSRIFVVQEGIGSLTRVTQDLIGVKVARVL